MHRLVRRLVLLPSIAIALLIPAVAPAGALAARDFPAGWKGFHTYPEMVADIQAVAAAHPGIVHLFSIGTSYQGRELWAAKVSDNVGTDENEPEVLFDGLHHSDEHMGLEMTLHILHWLTDGYGSSSRITSIVDTREIWIVFAMNPDGAQFDIKGGHFHFWRKNRQPTPGSSAIGTDLNRNYDYRWGLGGRTSKNPEAITYHGPKPFSAPETRAMRDFLASRVVGGRQQIRVAITFHEAGRLVMWPYGYTKKNVPPDMTSLDHLALRDIGRHMAKTNGYKPEQGSDLYITHGGSRDYLYGTYRIFAYTFEMSNRDYPKTSFIAPETGRNKEAVLWLAERAWCPLSVLGASVRQVHCGAFDDDFEVGRGWTVNPDGTDTAPASGRFARGNPDSSRRRRRPAPAVDREVRAGGVCHRAVRRVIGQRERPRRPDDDPVGADHAAGGHGPALRVQLLLRTRRQRVVGGPPSRDRRGWRHPDGPVRDDRLRHRGSGQLADRLGSDGCLGGPDDPAPVRGPRRWPGLDGRGRHRRRAHLAPDELTRRSVQRGDHLGDRRGDRVGRVAAGPRCRRRQLGVAVLARPDEHRP